METRKDLAEMEAGPLKDEVKKEEMEASPLKDEVKKEDMEAALCKKDEYTDGIGVQEGEEGDKR